MRLQTRLFRASAMGDTLLPTPMHGHARNAAGPQIRARLFRTPERHPHVRHLHRRSPAATTPSRPKTRPAARQNENASPPVRDPEPETDTFRGETRPERGGPPQVSPLRPGAAASARSHGTHAGNESAAPAPAGATLARLPQLPGVLA